MNKEQVRLLALQLQADIPEVANELRTAIKAHHEDLAARNIQSASWARVMKAVHHFIEVNLRISDVMDQSYEIRENEK